MTKYLKILIVASLLAYPIAIQADTAVIPTPSSPTGAIQVNIPQGKTVWITAYTSAPEETSNHPLITASGNMVRDGIVAVNFLPFGTKIQIPALFGDKVFVVEDRMNQKFNQRVDIWMPSVAKAVNFGIRSAQIVIVGSNQADLATRMVL